VCPDRDEIFVFTLAGPEAEIGPDVFFSLIEFFSVIFAHFSLDTARVRVYI